MAVEILPAVGRWDHFAALLAKSGCVCMAYRNRSLDTLGRLEYMRGLCEREPGPGVLAFVDGEIAGTAGLHPVGKSPRREHARMLGMTVASRHQGMGVGNTLMEALIGLADKWLPVTRIELTVFTDNERAIALYRKFGFEIEGTHKAYALRDGKYVDTYAMARIRNKGSGPISQ